MKLLKYQQLPLNPAGNPAGNRFSTTETTLTTFQIKSTNIYVPVVTLFSSYFIYVVSYKMTLHFYKT